MRRFRQRLQRARDEITEFCGDLLKSEYWGHDLPEGSWQKLLPKWLHRRGMESNAPQPLIKFGQSPLDWWWPQDAYEGCLIMGASGSGKTSASGYLALRQLLLTGAGGLITTVKPDDREFIESVCREIGRLDDLIVFGDPDEHRFNPLMYESTRMGRGGGRTLNVVDLLLTLTQIGDSGNAKQSNDPFWEKAPKALLTNVIGLLQAAREDLTMAAIRKVITSAPQDVNYISDTGWQQHSLCYHCLKQAESWIGDTITRHDYETLLDYWMVEHCQLDHRTRSNIETTLSVTIDLLNRDLMYELFGNDCTITPEVTHEGKIWLVDLPVKEYGTLGRMAQVLIKTCWQQAAERRTVNQSTRPLLFFCDEFQEFTTLQDAAFQATARSSKVCSILLTQSISGLYSRLGHGAGGKDAVEALLANLNTKIFHANSDPVTGEWVERLFAKDWSFRANASVSQQQGGGRNQSGNVTSGVNPNLESQVLAGELTRLRTGGPLHGGLVDAYIYRNGRRWSNGKNYFRTTFTQPNLNH